MKSKLLLFFFASIVILNAGCNNVGCITGSGKQVSQTREIGDFRMLKASGSMKVFIRQDSAQSVKITADDNIIDHIESRVKGNTLEIGMERGMYCTEGDITVYISSKYFNGLDASGANEIVTEGKFNTENFDLDLSGSNKVKLDLNAADVRTQASGSSEIVLSGQARSHTLSMSGSGEVNALNFTVGEYKIESSGASKCSINVLKSLKVNSSGSSEIVYRGSPSVVNNDNSGASSIKRVD
ncbi:hypothetical protein GS399_09380 [Pedobacter sp. HMF7647]|uniref:Putative auto-transporter adhesin head GIN domain-containing protein n=1 Tax=Hufsiella arboris TaxID=2695275 RepID=A0A7K1YAP6_9SPHI|nr:head GIN domain-containing protein [Hufsiella arboris]MXV51179.1 hypothetical protein [Hufsiella arboris]